MRKSEAIGTSENCAWIGGSRGRRVRIARKLEYVTSSPRLNIALDQH